MPWKLMWKDECSALEQGLTYCIRILKDIV
jgi:hypothetical protein